MNFIELRRQYHIRLCKEIIRIKENRSKRYPNFADSGNKSSIDISWEIVNQLNCEENTTNIAGQTAGGRFETITRDFLEQAFKQLHHIRPGRWLYSVNEAISSFDQYDHLAYLEEVFSTDTGLASAMGSDYIVAPDIVIGRYPLTDDEINAHETLIDGDGMVADLTALRSSNREKPYPILHASISCKWTIRSDRAQNTRTEALNLIRNRKGHTPHIAAVTAEPLPTRLAALALGTGDLDCVYHFALYELISAINSINNEDQMDMLNTLIQGRRLRDISDLPFDLVI